MQSEARQKGGIKFGNMSLHTKILIFHFDFLEGLLSFFTGEDHNYFFLHSWLKGGSMK